MRHLALETTGPLASIAVMEAETVLVHRRFRHERMLSRDLIPLVSDVLDEAGLGPRDLQGVSVCLGPGSFTSLRIGVTAAKCLAWALDVPAAGAGALDAMIAASPEGSGPVLAAVAASAEQAFALCRGRGAGEGDLLPAGLYDDTELRRFLEQVGAVAAAEPALAVRLGATVAEGAAEGPDAVTVGRLAMPALRAGGTPVHALVPLYLRRSIPEERLDGRGR